jgi:hypothetical protein
MKKLISFFVLLCICLTCFGQAQLGVTNRFALPQIAGVRLREANISNGTNDSGNGPLYGVPANYYDMDYYWNSNGPSGDEFDDWVVPQIKAAKTAGANCIRLMWDSTVVIGDSSHHGAATWIGNINYNQLTNEIGMVATACATNGMWFYPTATDCRVVYQAGLGGTTPLFQYISNFVYAASLYDNVACIDLVQEFNGSGEGTNGPMVNSVPSYISWAKAAMIISGRKVPITCSLNGAGQSSDLNINNLYPAALLASSGADYFDCHAYYQYSIVDFYQTVTNKWNLPVIFGETGMNLSGQFTEASAQESTHPYSSELRQDFFFTAQEVALQPYYQLTGIWAIAPNWLSDSEDFGLYSGLQDTNFNFTQPRDQLRNYQMFPTNIQPPNYTWSVVCTGVNTYASSYSPYTRYAIESGMADVSQDTGGAAPMWQRQNNCIQAYANIYSLNYPDGEGILYQSALPNTYGLYVQFDIPPQTPALFIGEYCNWEAIVRGQANGDLYLCSLSSDNEHTYDNKVEIFTYISGTKTSLGAITYSSALDLTKWWRVIVTSSTNINPTTITMSVSNMTDGILMSPSLVVSDSSTTLQSPGGMGLSGYLGTPNYTNINFQSIWDYSPSMFSNPNGTTTGSNISLTWNTSTGGYGTITYVPQYNVRDSFGFPSTITWTNGSPTVSTSETLSNLPNNTNIIIRIMSSDTVGETNYSSWQFIQTGNNSPFGNVYIPFKSF